jgi:hypothetical protein
LRKNFVTPTDITALRQLYTQHERIEAASPDVRREVLPNLIRQIPVETGDRGAVIYSRLDAANADAAIQAQIAYFEQLGCDFEWKHYDYDTPPDLKARLAAHGFELEETEMIMALPLALTPAALLRPVTHDVRRIHDPNELDAIQRIKTEVWGAGKRLRHAISTDDAHTGAGAHQHLHCLRWRVAGFLRVDILPDGESVCSPLMPAR